MGPTLNLSAKSSNIAGVASSLEGPVVLSPSPAVPVLHVCNRPDHGPQRIGEKKRLGPRASWARWTTGHTIQHHLGQNGDTITYCLDLDTSEDTFGLCWGQETPSHSTSIRQITSITSQNSASAASAAASFAWID